MSTDEIIDKASAELVEQILEESNRPTGTPWFFIVRAKLAALVRELKEMRKR